MRNLSFILATCGLLIFPACTRKASEKTVLKIKMPDKIMSSKSVHIKESSSLWGVQAPSSVGAADCFAVYATQPDLSNGTCTSISGEIGVIAFKSASGACQGMMDGSLAANFSAPMIVGKTTMDLVSGTTEVSIPVSTSNAKSFESCTGGPLQSWPVRSCTPSIAKMV